MRTTRMRRWIWTRCWEAVSYTHLDVYKRQQHGKRAGRKTPYYRALTALIHELRSLGAEEAAPFERTLDALPEGIADVYKRQASHGGG